MSKGSDTRPVARVEAVLAYPRNPAYGSGAGRRIIRLASGIGWVRADLSDTYHQMHIDLQHADGIVRQVAGGMTRYPTTACPGAADGLRSLEGRAIATPLPDLYRSAGLQGHCTHLFDLALLALGHAARPPQVRTYAAAAPDAVDDPVWIMIERDGAPVHRWRVQDGLILEPEPLAGRPLLGGFLAWASQAFEGDAFEAALILERCWFIARGRPYLTETLTGQAITANAAMIGSCFAYQAERATHARFRSGQVREYPDL